MSKELSLVLASIFVAIALLFGTTVDSDIVRGDSNVTVILNVTNTEPVFIDLFVDDFDLSPANEISLVANGTREVICNATVSDFNGYSDISNGSSWAAFFDTDASDFNSTPDNNFHYRNYSCGETYQIAGAPNNATVICRFNVQYYANNDTWQCAMNVTDNGGTQLPASKKNFSTNASDLVTINELLAMVVPITLVDYGNLSVTETSGEKVINVTNAGNIQTNFTVAGFGGTNFSLPGANLSAMLCEQGNISIDNERYSNTTGVSWADMIKLNASDVKVGNITLFQRTNDSGPQFAEDLNLTYWRIYVPLGVGGICNGTIMFKATNN